VLQDLNAAGFHRFGRQGVAPKAGASSVCGAVTLSGKLGADAKPYRRKQVAEDRGGSGMKKSDNITNGSNGAKRWGVHWEMPDLITGIHGDAPKKVYADLCQVIER